MSNLTSAPLREQYVKLYLIYSKVACAIPPPTTKPPITIPTMAPGTPCEICVLGVCSGRFLNCPPLTPICATASYTVNGMGKKESTCKSVAQCPGFINDHKDKEDAVVSF